MSSVTIFASTFVVVLALGLQSLAVNSGQRALAFGNSFLIGICNLALLRLVPTTDGVAETVAYLTGGPIGIVCAMSLHPRLVRWFRKG